MTTYNDLLLWNRGGGTISGFPANENSGSFWEPGNYKRTTQRIVDGHRLCKDLEALVKERADIEKAYAKNLHDWAKKWGELVEYGSEYGTTKLLWKGIVTEAEKLGDVHIKIKDKLCNDVIKEMKHWRKNTYHKSVLQIMEKKEMEEAFRNAQKPWEKLFQKVQEAKFDYHSAYRTERSAFNQLSNAFSDADLKLNQVQKIQERSIQSRKNLHKAKRKYELVLQHIDLYNSKYIEDMTGIFDKCQKMEAERLQFFQQIIFFIHKCLNLSQDPAYLQTYDELYEAIKNADPGQDLEWWSKKHGTLMVMKWPTFEEYQEGSKEIVKGQSKMEVASGTTLTTWRAFGEDVCESGVHSKIKELPEHEENDNHDQSTSKATGKIKTHSYVTRKDSRRSTNPFDEDESDDDTGETFVDYGEPGIPVRALYTYEGTATDELNFKQGDVFEKLEEQDWQGWCKGRKDGRVGLFPANYVKFVEK